MSRQREWTTRNPPLEDDFRTKETAEPGAGSCPKRTSPTPSATSCTSWPRSFDKVDGSKPGCVSVSRVLRRRRAVSRRVASSRTWGLTGAEKTRATTVGLGEGSAVRLVLLQTLGQCRGVSTSFDQQHGRQEPTEGAHENKLLPQLLLELSPLSWRAEPVRVVSAILGQRGAGHSAGSEAVTMIAALRSRPARCGRRVQRARARCG